jgi:hypothetical protein
MTLVGASWLLSALSVVGSSGSDADRFLRG